MESATTQQQTASESEQKTEEAQTKTEIPPEPEKEKVIKLSLKQKIQLKASEINQKFSIKYPKAAKKTSTAVNYISEVWKETFPKNQDIAKSKIDERRERAKLAKELELKAESMTPEELEAYMETIPEWKRGALVVQNNTQEDKEVQGVFRKIRAKISGTILETDAAKNFKQSEAF